MSPKSSPSKKRVQATKKSIKGTPSFPTTKTPVTFDKHFPIIALGASAGGLEALERFFSRIPQNSGMAFIIIQHLDPTRKGIMPELIQRITKAKVIPVKDRLKIKPNCVYVTPSNKNMSILNNSLHLFEPLEKRGLRLPIDFFFHSLADDQKERSIGVILSGMGQDGSEGIKAIKEKGGIVLVQEPVSAKFDSMPRSAIIAVVPDIVAPPEELPEKFLSMIAYSPLKGLDLPEEMNAKDKSSLDKIIILLRTGTGHDFSLYKKNTM
ncbi:MAG: chemotaxis protein CheB, partial [Oligoflexia bacterium]|nr:chemotaxis protein CheB [Oligoflexia bacterium]